MKNIKLIDNSIIYIESWKQNEETGRYKIYDSDKRYLDYYYADGGTRKDYFDFIKYLENLDCYECWEYFCSHGAYDFNGEARLIMETYCNDLLEGYEVDVVKEEVKDILFDIYTMTEEELCEEYDINHIGNMYFRGNW